MYYLAIRQNNLLHLLLRKLRRESKLCVMAFIQKLEAIVAKNNSLACIGLDSDLAKIPDRFKKKKYPQFEFNKSIIDKTYDLVGAYKPNSAFYEAHGAKGIEELKMTFDYLNKNFPGIVTILDAKHGDISSTNDGYVKYAFDYLGADGITLHPYLGKKALAPFLSRRDKGCIILCRTSNPGAEEFQDIRNSHKRAAPSWLKLFEYIALRVVNDWNTSGNCLLVVGATYPKELADVRKLVGDDMWFLVPGVGAQGGDMEKTVKAGQNSKGTGMIINSSRGIIFAKDPRKAAKELKEEINKHRVALKKE